MVSVELVYIPPGKKPVHRHLVLAPGATVADVLHQSHILQSHPETEGMPVGIFAKPATLTTVVKTGDRIEIYRPLLIDPKEKRRQRARR